MFSIHAKANAEGVTPKPRPAFVMVNGRMVRKNNAKPIGNGKNAGCTRSMVKGTDITHKFKSTIGTNFLFHKWAK